jgi:GntR family transcriptional regulator, transcriptional repressor for pyruvate dehydrogenase complex
MTTKKIKNSRLIYESVLEYLKSELLRGNLRPGSQLPTVAALAEQLNVGQASVREAYRILQSKGVLEVTQGRGTFVSTDVINIDDTLTDFHLSDQPSRVHLLEARRLLEPGIAALAAQRATSAEIQLIQELAQRPDQQLPSHDEWVELNIEFHDAVAIAAHNPVITQMVRAIYDVIRDSQPVVDYVLPDAMKKGISYHKLIALAIQDGNPEAAQTLMHQHIAGVEEKLVLMSTEVSEPG